MTDTTFTAKYGFEPFTRKPANNHFVVCINSNWIDLTKCRMNILVRHLDEVKLRIVHSMLTEEEDLKFLREKQEALEGLVKRRLESEGSDR